MGWQGGRAMGNGIGASRRRDAPYGVGRGWLGVVFGQQMWETLGRGGRSLFSLAFRVGVEVTF